MQGDIDNYKKIHVVILTGFVMVTVLLGATALTAAQSLIVQLIGEYSYHVLKVVPWGGYGALMQASFLSAKDKARNHKLKAALASDPTGEQPDYPDANDVVMYFFYILSGLVMATLSAFLLDTGIEYVGPGQPLAVRDKYGLFAMFAFYAGYSQAELVGRLRKKVTE